MQYPGNPGLSPEVQQRILGTYQQTLDLAAKGNRQEALLGCDFILRMDPAFRPARELQARVNASAAGAPVSVADLAPGAAPTPPRAPAPAVAPPPTAVPPPVAPRPAVVAPPAAGAHAGGNVLEAALEDLLAKRDLRRLVQVAEENRGEVGASPALRKVVETAYARLEAEPYVKNFLDSARASLGLGDFDEADRLIEKARSLDPTHPEVAELAEERRGYEVPDDPWAGMPPEFARGLGRQSAADPLAAHDLAGHEIDPALVTNSESLADFEGMPRAGAAAGGDGRIAELLRQGQEAFDRGDYQGAIDAWSRIFLIDIDHEEAARRIDQARRLKAEGERKVEEIFHEGAAAFEAGDREKAQRLFERVLTLQPSYYAAREYMEQLGAPVGTPAVDDYPPIENFGGDPLADTGGVSLQQEILVPPTPGARPAPRPAVSKRTVTAASTGRSASAKPVKAKRAGSRFLLIGGVVLALLLALGVFAWMNKGLLFPNSKPAATSRKAADELARARKLHDDGKVEVAIRQLRLLEPEHPGYADAQKLLATWEAEGKAAVAAVTGPVTPELMARFERDVARGKEANAAGEHLLADAYFRRAARVAPLPPESAAIAANAAAKLEPLAKEIALFRQQEWSAILPTLWRLREAEPGNKDVNKLIVDSYYNLAVRDLQGGDVPSALGKLDQALELKPGDEVLRRNRSFAASYARRQKDLLYRIYVSHLPIL